MDDIVSGAPDLETAQQLQLKDALQFCGMNLHKWSSNSPELLNSSLSSGVEHSFSTDIDLSVKTLGISWKPFEDCFVFKVSVSTKHIYTKREVLSVIAKLYDPFGFLGPVIANAKVFLQQLWQCKLDWDDVLPNSIANEWREFVTTLNCIEEVKNNRFIMADKNVRIVLQDLRMHLKRPTDRSFTYSVFFKTVLPNDGLLRVGGRLSNSDLPYVNKHPAILPGNHKLTVKIISHFHRKNLHTGAFSVLHYLMGNPPRDRVVPDYPFNCSGANKELKRFLKLIEDSDDNLAGLLSAEGIEWKFIPPRAPSFGGLWEASVKSIKYHLKRVVSGSNLTYDEFLTVCIQIEGILNSRPLCALYRAIRMT
ncbi:integrase catalytic domain-containing protein [Trichonephila clavipes]|nr:integrase catalytic domain-containing protein [Trichonephila clavipes]